MKACTRCGVEKEDCEFTLRWNYKKTHKYKGSQCKQCAVDRVNEYRQNNPNSRKEEHKKYRENNRGKYNARRAKERAHKRNATPNWLTDEELTLIALFYRLCSAYSKNTGIKHHVDHILPLAGETVCGLHTISNLQILEASDNIRKSNRVGG